MGNLPALDLSQSTVNGFTVASTNAAGTTFSVQGCGGGAGEIHL
jgi:hypothetical protein